VQYVREVEFVERNGHKINMQDWLRQEWERTGLSYSKANEACGVKSAATRKYLCRDAVWYMPPPEMFGRLVRFANQYGPPDGRPYFSLDGKEVCDESHWNRLRVKFTCPVGVTNVWDCRAVHGKERILIKGKPHPNQKPLKLFELLISCSSEIGDVIWEPFGGLCPAALVSRKLERQCFSAEKREDYYEAAVRRLE
jgi:site-specific DNA-methyltransferase (adenine-specific)